MLKASDIKNASLRNLFVQTRSFLFMGELVRIQCAEMRDTNQTERRKIYEAATIQTMEELGFTK